MSGQLTVHATQACWRFGSQSWRLAASLNATQETVVSPDILNAEGTTRMGGKASVHNTKARKTLGRLFQ